MMNKTGPRTRTRKYLLFGTALMVVLNVALVAVLGVMVRLIVRMP